MQDMKFIPQCKGKDLKNVAPSKLHEEGWFISIKYDGNYVQIHKKGNKVIFYTSGGKPFLIEYIADELIENNPTMDFVLEAEYIADTEGLLGSRGKCTTTTYRTNYAKGLPSTAKVGKDKFMVFNTLKVEAGGVDLGIHLGNKAEKYALLSSGYFNFGDHIRVIKPAGPFKLDKIDVKSFLEAGYEGLVLEHELHRDKSGKILNTIIKLKGRDTADLLCIDTEQGTGKYVNLIGSLVLQDSEGRIVSVGSGLSDVQRSYAPNEFIGKVIEIEYEKIDKTYIQPTFKQIRLDKEAKDID